MGLKKEKTDNEQMLEALLALPARKLTQWERKFLADVSSKIRGGIELNENRQKVLENLWAKKI